MNENIFSKIYIFSKFFIFSVTYIQTQNFLGCLVKVTFLSPLKTNKVSFSGRASRGQGLEKKSSLCTEIRGGNPSAPHWPRPRLAAYVPDLPQNGDDVDVVPLQNWKNHLKISTSTTSTTTSSTSSGKGPQNFDVDADFPH